MTLNEKLKYLRSLENLPQHMIASILKIERSTYSYYESGKTTPNIYMLYAIARIYDLPMEFFVDDNWELDGADEFYRTGAKNHGHKNSENARYMQNILIIIKGLCGVQRKRTRNEILIPRL